MIRTVEELVKELLRRYDREPRGWSMLADRRGNVLVVGPGIGYKLKLVSIDPKRFTGVGTEIKDFERVSDLLNRFPPYGFRPLPKGAVEMFLRGELRPELLRKVVELEPVPSWEFRNAEAILSGPIISHPDLSVVSSSQRKLEERLAIEADKLFRRLYPRRASIYG